MMLYSNACIFLYKIILNYAIVSYPRYASR